MKKTITIILSAVMIITTMIAGVPTASAASLPTTKFTTITPISNGYKLKWTKKSGITGYQIQYATDKKFTKNMKKVKVSKASTVSKSITGLKAKKTYYLRIRTYKTKNKKTTYSKWSGALNKKTKAASSSTQKHCTNNNNHSIKCGSVGIWVASKNEFKTYYESYCEKWNNKYENGEITYQEYVTKVPYGYECWSCGYCGKWTGNFKYNEDSDTTTQITTEATTEPSTT